MAKSSYKKRKLKCWNKLNQISRVAADTYQRGKKVMHNLDIISDLYLRSIKHMKASCSCGEKMFNKKKNSL